jgi:fumarate reductase (CoM/CoB) subunit A
MALTMVTVEEIGTDVLVIGSGAAGLRAAIAASQEGARTLIVSKGTPALGSATILSDGFFASSGSGMDPPEHMRLTMETGYHRNQPELVKILTEETPARLEELARRGIPFATDPGGKRAPRIRLGNIVVPHVLLQWAIEEGASPVGSTTVTDLVREEGRVTGAVAVRRGTVVRILAKATILCTGGASALYLCHDNPTTNLGDGYAIAARAGATLRDMEFIQFYPFVTREPGKPRILIGPPFSDIGKVVNDRDEDLVEKYRLGAFKPLGLRARDRLSRALYQEFLAGRRIFLDLRSMREEDWRHPGAAGEGVRTFYENRFSCRTKPLPIMPAAHFTIGGVAIDDSGRTGVEGMFAAGEVAWGLHGANRMGGNALSETLVFGARAGRTAALAAREASGRRTAPPATASLLSLAGPVAPARAIKRLKEILWTHCGPVRTEGGLAQGLDLVGQLEKERVPCKNADETAIARTAGNALLVARMILESARSRRESLGAHYRED